ncbi:hypothetical protein C0J08_05935 [Marinomonas sp. CT5]|nr:hypothetical protein C0J08_05935 [Marinomonas sp. CT5]
MLSGVLLLISQVLQAHPGHDHSHWSSDLIHLLTILSVGGIIVGSFVYKQLLRRVKYLQREVENHDVQCH